MRRSFAFLAAAILLATARPSDVGPALATAAKRQVSVTRFYDPSYVPLHYPGGDVPDDRGVCSDVVVRAFRRIGVDLQREVHEDMQRNFEAYPRMWGLSSPDANIDHRRVPNLMTFFQRRQKAVTGDFLPGDVVAWRLPGGLYHIGIVTARPLVIHNIGQGAREEAILFAYDIIGHYRW